MLFARKHNEYGCTMCGRLPVIKQAKSKHIDDIRNVTRVEVLYRLQCPRRHISSNWTDHPSYASRQWKELVDEYKREDTK